MVISELWKWLGDNGNQIAIVIAVLGLGLTVYGFRRKRSKLKRDIKQELGRHLKELLELSISTTKFIALSAGELGRSSSLTNYRPNILHLQYDDPHDIETIKKLQQLGKRCRNTHTRSIGGSTEAKWRDYATITISEIDKVIGHIIKRLW